MLKNMLRDRPIFDDGWADVHFFLNKPKKKVLQFNNITKIKENGFVKIIHM